MAWKRPVWMIGYEELSRCYTLKQLRWDETDDWKRGKTNVSKAPGPARSNTLQSSGA